MDDETGDERNQVNDRLQDLLDMHIVVANDEAEPLSGYLDEGVQPYFLTKAVPCCRQKALAVRCQSRAWRCGNGMALGSCNCVGNGDPARYEMTNGRTFL